MKSGNSGLPTVSNGYSLHHSGSQNGGHGIMKRNGSFAAFKQSNQKLFSWLQKLIICVVVLFGVFVLGKMVFMNWNGPRSTASLKATCPPRAPVEYVVMIDAGSTGSRVHVYEFAKCDPSPGAAPTLKGEVFHAIQPGLSAFARSPELAAKSLTPLMELAVKNVPEAVQSCTPVAVKATAGLRLLGSSESEAILQEVDRWLRDEWPFYVPPYPEGVNIMEGRDEAVYAWITTNYLLGVRQGDMTAAVMDLGGASTQIVFEPGSSSSKSNDPKMISTTTMEPGSHIYNATFGGASHMLYQYSHLGYGLKQARRAVHNLVAFSHEWHSVPVGGKITWDLLTAKDEVPHPCLSKDSTKQVLLDPPSRKPVNVTMRGSGAGFNACRRVVDVALAKDYPCKVPPCSLSGVYQPRFTETFDGGRIYALSYFYDRISPLGLGPEFRLHELEKLAKDVCAGAASTSWQRFINNEVALKELADRPESCLDLTFMYSLLSLGYELEQDRVISIAKKMDDVELGWCLGAALALTGNPASVSCKA